MNYKDFIKIAKDIIRKIEDERPGEVSLTDASRPYMVKFIPIEKGMALKNSSISIYLNKKDVFDEVAIRATMKLIVDRYTQRQHGPTSQACHSVDVFFDNIQVGQVIETNKNK